MSDNKFTQGYVCAVAALVSMHDIGSMAEEALGCAGIINWSEISSTDIEWLKEGNINIEKYGYKDEAGK